MRAYINVMSPLHGLAHKVLTYVEYREVAGVFENINPTPPLSTQRVFPPPAPKAVRGWGVNIQYFGRRQTLD